MKVKDVMSTDVACCRRETPLKEVARMMVDCDCGEIPVTDDAGRPIGVVTDRDIVCRSLAQGRNPLELTAGDCLTSPALTVGPEVSLAECCQRLEENQVRRLPVVDAAGRCIGIVALADVARHASKRSTAEVVQRVSEPSVRASAVAP
jgi:CBS domain-containing protein